jgi:hypothetical protein
LRFLVKQIYLIIGNGREKARLRISVVAGEEAVHFLGFVYF